MGVSKDILDLVKTVKANGEAVAVATVVRTSSVTSAKAGARAVITADGTLSGGWMSGDAVLRAARQALADGQPRLIHLESMDVCVEPMLPRPVLAIFGASPVGVALSDLARRMGFFVVVCTPAAEHAGFPEADRLVDGLALPADVGGDLYLVIATQGTGDRAALSAAVRLCPKYLAVVGPRQKAVSLKRDLATEGIDAQDLEKIRSPAGIDIGAITPEEIALSIVADMIKLRRRGQRRRSSLD